MIIDNLFNPKRTIVEGSAANDYFTRRKSEEERIAGTRAPAKNKKNPANTDYAKKRKQQDVEEGHRPFRGVGGAFNRGDDEHHDRDPSDWYKKVGTKMYTASIYPRQVAQAQREGWHRTKEEARANASPEGVAEGMNDDQGTSVDEILYHLTSAYRSLQKHSDFYQDFSIITHVYETLRSYLKEGDIEGFHSSYERMLSRYPDAAVELFDAMFESAGLPSDTGTIEQFLDKCSQQGVAEGSGFDKWADDRSASQLHKLKRDHSTGKKSSSAPVQQDGEGWEQRQIEKMKKYRSPEQGVAEAVTYPQKHSSWSVQSPKKNEFNTPYKLHQGEEAKAHAERIGGKLVKVDQRGHAIRASKGVAEGFDSAAFDRHMDKLRAQKELEKTDPMRAMVNKMKSDYDYNEKSKSKSKQDDERQITDPFHPSQGVNIGEQGVAEAEKNPHTSALGKALYRDLSKQPKLSPQQVQRNKERWAQRQAEGQWIAKYWDKQSGNEPVERSFRSKEQAVEFLSNLPDHYVKALRHSQGVAEGSELKQAKRKYNQAAKDANADQVGAGKKIDTMKKSLRQKDVAKQGVAEGLSENAEDLHIGDPVIITGNGIKFEGATGEIVDFGQQHRFVVVNLYNHGKHSFHSSDVSFNEYAGSDDEEARMYDAGEFGDDPRDEMDEARMSAAQRLSNAWDKQRAKSDASLRRTPSSIPKTVDKERMIRDIATSDASPEHKKAAIDAVMKTMSESRAHRQALMAQMLNGK